MDLMFCFVGEAAFVFYYYFDFHFLFFVFFPGGREGGRQKEKKFMKLGGQGSGEDLGGVDEEENMIKI